MIPARFFFLPGTDQPVFYPLLIILFSGCFHKENLGKRKAAPRFVPVIAPDGKIVVPLSRFCDTIPVKRLEIFDPFRISENRTMPGKINYQLILDETLREIRDTRTVPALLLHSCCAPCSSYCLEYLSDYFEITVFYYNPNIEDAEFDRRYLEQVRLIREMRTKHPVRVVRGEHDTGIYYSRVSGHETDPEGGERCRLCFTLRLEESARYSKEHGFDFFTTTLSISPLKDAQLLNSIGREMSERYGVRYLYSDFKKKNGYLRSVELSKQYSLYRQDYCGCVFSMRSGQPE